MIMIPFRAGALLARLTVAIAAIAVLPCAGTAASRAACNSTAITSAASGGAGTLTTTPAPVGAIPQVAPWDPDDFGDFHKNALATKTPYGPRGGLHDLTPPPAGAIPVFTQLLARHGARAATSDDDFAVVLQVLDAAKAAGTLTEKGATLARRTAALQKVNDAVGLGQLSTRGRSEQKQLAERLAQRLPGLFADAARQGRTITVINSGKDRAIDSSEIFALSLGQSVPWAAKLIKAPVSDPTTLYFFKQPENAAYQAYKKRDPDLLAAEKAVRLALKTAAAARELLTPLVGVQIVAALDAGMVTVKPNAEDGPATPNSVDVALAVYGVFQQAPALNADGSGPITLTPFLSPDEADQFARVSDTDDFYEKGPGFAGRTITFAMAKPLVDDFVAAMDRIAAGDLHEAARLRFAHAETVIPFAALLKLPHSATQQPLGVMFDDHNGWTGRDVASFSANIQWDAFRTTDGRLLVRMLYDEKEIAFKQGCFPVKDDSPYYAWNELKRCYGF